MTRTDSIVVWLLRAAWVTLPLTAGETIAAATTQWDDPLRVVALILVWLAWGLVLVALLAPRPVGLTAVRAVVPLGVAVVSMMSPHVSRSAGASAVTALVVAFALALAPPFAVAAVNGPAYGDERRFPLKIPPALFLGPLPIAIALVGAGVTAPPLLLAARQWVVGGVALVIGVPLAVVAVRSLHGLSRRFAVLVPAGFVLVDPSAISDPVLFRREHVVALGALEPRARPDADVVDLRLGAQHGGVSLALETESDMIHVRRGRRRSEVVPTRLVWFAVSGRETFLAQAGNRRLRVVRQAAIPPPSTTSSE